MGREIRRVPLDWQHPKDDEDNYIPLYDEDFDTVEAEWVKGRELWLKGDHPEQLTDYGRKHLQGMRWAEWSGTSPDPESYRERRWTADEATGYQVYETVSEGTPISPVFASLDDMITWLIGEGYQPEDAQAFAKHGWVPSMTFSPADGERSFGIHGAANVHPKDEAE